MERYTFDWNPERNQNYVFDNEEKRMLDLQTVIERLNAHAGMKKKISEFISDIEIQNKHHMTEKVSISCKSSNSTVIAVLKAVIDNKGE